MTLFAFAEVHCTNSTTDAN